jgi:sulfhydrogenase subunit beta (sulfur reductase)
MTKAIAAGARVTVSRTRFAALLHVLRARGYQLVGPRVRDGAIVYDPIDGIDDLPEGWTDTQEAGT